MNAEPILDLVCRGAESDPDRREEQSHRCVHTHCAVQQVKKKGLRGNKGRFTSNSESEDIATVQLEVPLNENAELVEIATHSSGLACEDELPRVFRDVLDESISILLPQSSDSVEMFRRLHAVGRSVEFGIDEIDRVVGGRLMLRRRMANFSEVSIERVDRSVEHDSPAGEKEKLVEEAEGFVVGLMNRANHDGRSSSSEKLHCSAEISIGMACSFARVRT